MILFCLISSLYVGVLLFLRPSPNSLKAAPLTFSQNFRCIEASLFSGMLFLGIFFITSNFTFIVIDEKLYGLLALNNVLEFSYLWPLQLITHLFIHFNLLHVLTNVTCLGITSAYERRVGSKRFLTVFAISGLASVPSVFFYSTATSICGISGGIFGLAAAYFTDDENLTIKEWIQAIIIFICLAILFALEGELRSHSEKNLQLRVDHIGHVLGAIGAIIYCRLRPAHKKSQENARVLA